MDASPALESGSGPWDRPVDDLRPLVERVRRRDEAAARELVERLYPLVARVVRAHLPRRDEPEDLMQEVFLKMFARLHQFSGRVPFEHWVTRMALTTALDRLRRQRARPEVRWADLTDDEGAVLDRIAAGAEAPDADAADATALLERLLATLPPADAWLLRQVELEEKPLAEVCAAAGWNAGAARVRLFRARLRLRAAFCTLEGGRS